MTRSPEAHGLGPHVVGLRVVVRRVLRGERGPSGGPAMTDVLGVCTSWGDGVCVVAPESGEPVSIALADIVAGKPVPPRPSVRHRVSAREAEGHVLSLWPGVEARDLGDWLLRCAPPYGGRLRRRANSVLAMGDPGVPFAEAERAILAFYDARARRPALAQVEADRWPEADFLAAGWTRLPTGEADFRIASVAQVLRAVPDPVGARTTVHEDGHHVVVDLGAGLGVARAALDGDWVGVHSLEVDPDHRRRGLGTALLAALFEWAAQRGATTAWLHVETDNPGAAALYGGLGFRIHHACRYLAAP